MPEKPTCPRCGYEGPEGARYCAMCGRSLAPQSARLTSAVNQFLDRLSPFQMVLFVIAMVLPLGLLAHYIILTKGMYFPVSYALLVLVLGIGGGYLGWLVFRQRPAHTRLMQAVFVIASMGLLLAMCVFLDRAILAAFADSDRTIVMSIPGIHLEASAGYKTFHMVVDNAPPYWLIAMGFIVLTASMGVWIQNATEKR